MIVKINAKYMRIPTIDTTYRFYMQILCIDFTYRKYLSICVAILVRNYVLFFGCDYTHISYNIFLTKKPHTFCAVLERET